MRTILLLLSLMLALPCAVAGNDDNYALLAKKERMFYNAREWPGAHAMLLMMIDEKPRSADLYGRDIVVQSLMNDTLGAVESLDKAMANHVPFDSVFFHIKETSFSLGRSELYERFLVRVKDSHAWLARTIDNYLLEYYCFRRNGGKMVEFSKIMLAGRPDNVNFLTILAEGYLLEGETENSMLAYRQVLHFSPENYQALLYLGNYHFNRWMTTAVADDAEQARKFLSRAYEVKPSPYVKLRLEQLAR